MFIEPKLLMLLYYENKSASDCLTYKCLICDQSALFRNSEVARQLLLCVLELKCFTEIFKQESYVSVGDIRKCSQTDAKFSKSCLR